MTKIKINAEMKFYCILIVLIHSVFMPSQAQNAACPPANKDQLRQIDAYISELQNDTAKFNAFIYQVMQHEQYTSVLDPIIINVSNQLKLLVNGQKEIKELLTIENWETIKDIVCQLLLNSSITNTYKFRYDGKIYSDSSTIFVDDGVSEIVSIEIVNEKGEPINNEPIQWTGATGTTGSKAEIVATNIGANPLEVKAVVNTTSLGIKFSKAKPLLIESVDRFFAPTVENLDIKYTVKVDTFKFAKLEIFKNGNNINPFYVNSISASKAEKVAVTWDGRCNTGVDNGKYVTYLESPLTIKITASNTANFTKTQSDNSNTKVEIESITLAPSGSETLIKQNGTQRNIDKEISATVKIRNKQGNGVPTALTARIHWTFEDPDDGSSKNGIDHNASADNDNTEPVHGGKDQTTGIFWRNFQGYQSNISRIISTSDVITTSGVNLGENKIYFSSSVIAGDNYILVARVKDAQGNVIKEQKTGTWTVRKKVTFNNIYTMTGGINFNPVMSVANIDPAFSNDDGCTDYTAPANINNLTPAQSPEFVAPLLTPVPISDSVNTELPTAQELADYNSGNAAVKAAAKAAIVVKAQHWFQRNMDQLPFKVDSLSRALNIQSPAIVGARYYHPKLSGRNTITHYYPPGIQINVSRPGNPAVMKDPDGDWRQVQAFEDGSTAWFFLNNTSSTARQIIVGRHETGHATDHISYGSGDHALSYLMHYNADQSATNPDGIDTFSEDSYEKLRGRR